MKLATPKRFKLALGAALALAALVAGARWLLFSASDEPVASSAQGLSTRNLAASAGGRGTPEYNQMIDELNRAGADRALELGESYAAVPVGVEPAQTPPATPTARAPRPAAPAADRPPLVEQPQSRPDAPARRTAKPPAEARAAADDGLRLALLADLRALPPPAPAGAWLAKKSAAEPSASPASAPAPPAFDAELRPGRILYAAFETAVNSDLPTPALARVLGGPLKGARLMGAFVRRDRALEVRFTRLTPLSGPSVNLEALAVDPSTSSPALSGQVDSHFWERWGGLAAASFLEGLGSAMSGRRATVSVYGDVVVTDGGRASMGEVAVEALGQVGGRAANQLEKGFDRPPTVTIDAGSLVGILILSAER
ncbi:MAG: DotG/IcmE/VirB10 family protein [Deltaproteobacteria bacterium]|jgi:type IV secretory pathway VirB10-like protein|nr:DotG/IcmE/VirB10 family protein [Deltaproteobacteria bacterium]